METKISGKSVRIHRIICQAFKPIDNPENMIVNHIDENRKNNCIDNLEWTTYKGNSKAYHYSGREYNKNFFSRPVIRIDTYGNNKRYESVTLAAEEEGVKSISNISAACRNINKTVKGYYWRFDD